MGSDRRLFRRHVEKLGQLKENTITIDKGRLQKKREKEQDITVETPEYQLLVKLFVPSKLLIHNNRVSQKNLSDHLPQLVTGSFPALNFKLHIFLSSIVTSYVASWYSLKLNTDNFEFLESVYYHICDFVKDFAERVLKLMKTPQLLDLFNKWAFILESHIRLVHTQDGIPKFASEILTAEANTVSSRSDINIEILRELFLERSHAIFTTCGKSDPSVLHQYVSAEGDDKIDEEEKIEANSRLQYLRLMVTSIVTVAFSRPDSKSKSSPISSAITMNLISAIVADLIIDRLITKVSSPRFILQTVIGNLAMNIDNQLNKEAPKTKHGLIESVKKTASTLYRWTSYLGDFVTAKITDKTPDPPNILFSPLFSLIKEITSIDTRRPIITKSFGIIRSSIASNRHLSARLETAIGRYIMDRTRQDYLQDEVQANLVQKLQDSVFGSTDAATNSSVEPADLSGLTELCFRVLSEDLSSLLPMGISILSFRYQNESTEEMRKCVEDLLRVFDPENTTDEGGFSRESKLNTLLVIRLLDCTIQDLYPELIETLSLAA